MTTQPEAAALIAQYQTAQAALQAAAAQADEQKHVFALLHAGIELGRMGYVLDENGHWYNTQGDEPPAPDHPEPFGE